LKSITESSLKLNYYLHSRHLPLENHQLITKLQKVEKCLNDIQAKKNGEHIAIEDIDFQRDRKARNILKQNIYNWQPINFDKSTCLTYLVARSVQNYAVLHRILNEIKKRDKDFKPETMFDFGSGIGTVMW
jgi:ribosomal protein RSM22 (predicted rRNA methylase)